MVSLSKAPREAKSCLRNKLGEMYSLRRGHRAPLFLQNLSALVLGVATYSMNPFGMILSESEGIVGVVAEKKYGELLGVHMIGKAASEMAGLAVLAIQMRATLAQLSRTCFPHPTLSESLAEAARDAHGNPIYLP